MPGITDNHSGWGSRRTFIMVLLCQYITMPMFVTLPNVAAFHGATGYTLCYLAGCLALGIPILYMEFFISQFTARDCIDVWKVRPCFSHIGYILVILQFLAVVNDHVTSSFTFHYLLISFERPVPYYTCGPWSLRDCDILKHNYTVNEDCIRRKDPAAYCDNLFMTFPEYQYWKFNILGGTNQYFSIAWRVCLASVIICVITYLSCFKRKESVRLVVLFYTCFPIVGYALLLLVTMLQKGVILLFHEALDTDFSEFFEHFRLSLIIMQVVTNLGMGSGLAFNIGLSASFRTPCYSNTVLVVMISAVVSALAVCTTAMMACPYASEYGIKPIQIIGAHMALVYEKIPRLLREYHSSSFWVIVALSSLTTVSLSSNVIILHHLLDVIAARSATVAKYPGLTILLIIILLNTITIPLLSLIGVTIVLSLRRFSGFITTFVAFLETVVFMIWYGFDRFAEDVHFMQGIQPKTFMKMAWLSSSVILLYVFCYEIYIKYAEYTGTITDNIGWLFFIVTMSLLLGILFLKLSIAAFKHRFLEMIRLDRSWGPRDEVLQRSRAMFTAQAMTKEYLYRQYHLKAGILARQKMSNCRN